MRITEAENIIKIENLFFEYRSGEDDTIVRAIDGVSLEVERGSLTSIIGQNGSGKSTLAKNINALQLPSGGRILVDGFDTIDESKLWDIRKNVGMVFQNPDNQIVSAVVEDDVAFGPENLGIEPDEIRKRIRIALDAVAMSEFSKMAPHLLSGGQKQRIAIAGVIAMKPKIIIFDEPTAMLDPEGRREVMNIISKLHDEGITILLITHFMDETINSDRIIIMDKGKIAFEGTPTEIYSQPEEIETLGLRLPFSVGIAARLRERGIDVPGNLLTLEELADAIVNLNNRKEIDSKKETDLE